LHLNIPAKAFMVTLNIRTFVMEMCQVIFSN
jgi:hypothetical protein